MDLGHDNLSDSDLLSGLAADVKARESLVVREWISIVTWADRNIVTTPEQAATIVDGVIDTGVPIAGDGAPLVSEFNLMELIAVLGRTPDGGRGYVGRVIECAWRLPGIYASVVEGRLAPWRAERIADLTRPLNADAAAFVDRQLAAVGGVGWAQLERLVTEAVIRFDPERAEAERQAAADARRFDFGDVDANGLVESHALLDAADAHDLDQALTRRAILRGKLGDDSALDVRRSKAAGDLARTDLSLDLLISDAEEGDGQVGRVAAEERTHQVGRVAAEQRTHEVGRVAAEERAHQVGRVAAEERAHQVGRGAAEERAHQVGRGAAEERAHQVGRVAAEERAHQVGRVAAEERGGVSRPLSPGRKVTLNVHITDTALTGDNPVGRWDEGRTPISTTQIKEWLQVPGTTVTVRPVIDLKDCIPVDSYEIPDRIRRRVELRDHTCRFPWCNRPATKCDLDHVTPHNKGGPTCPCNLVPGCRRHHRAKTFSRWRYLIIEPGTYLWISPKGHHFLVDHTGTRALDPPRSPDSDH